jgi:FkbM family methyltransferase
MKMKNIVHLLNSDFSVNSLMLKYGIEVTGLLHLGANKGQEALIYENSKIPKVIWVEGYQPYFDELVNHIQNLPNQTAYNFFISDVDNEVSEFNIASNEGSSTLFEANNSFKNVFKDISFVEKQKISTRRIDSYFIEKKISLDGFSVLVADLEGYELKALKSMGNLLDGFKWLLIEVSTYPNYIGAPLLEDIDKYLYSRGYKRISIKVGKTSGDALYRRQNVTKFDQYYMTLSSRTYSLIAKYKFYVLKDVIKKIVKILTD